MQKYTWKIGFLGILFLLILVGCISAKTPTPTSSPLELLNTDTPASLESDMGTKLPPGIGGGVPVAPNLSLIQAKIIATSQGERGMVLIVEVLSSQQQDGFADFGAAVIGNQIEVLVNNDVDITYSVGQIIQGELSYKGDEHGGIYHLRNISQP